MRARPPERLDAGRLREGYYASHWGFGMNGAFLVAGPCGVDLKMLASDGADPISQGWQHVSVSLAVKHIKRPPNWQEMCFVKDLFFEDEETVVQFHPKKSRYVNAHPYCLHLWRRPHPYDLPPEELLA